MSDQTFEFVVFIRKGLKPSYITDLYAVVFVPPVVEVCSAMPYFLHISIILKPASASLRIRMMCSGENRFRLILSPPVIFLLPERTQFENDLVFGGIVTVANKIKTLALLGVT